MLNKTGNEITTKKQKQMQHSYIFMNKKHRK